eukprot:7298164-Lingulodinium_polyedra.AAC.1
MAVCTAVAYTAGMAPFLRKMTMALRQSSGPQTSGASASPPAAAAFSRSRTSGAPRQRSVC